MSIAGCSTSSCSSDLRQRPATRLGALPRRASRSTASREDNGGEAAALLRYAPGARFRATATRGTSTSSCSAARSVTSAALVSGRGASWSTRPGSSHVVDEPRGVRSSWSSGNVPNTFLDGVSVGTWAGCRWSSRSTRMQSAARPARRRAHRGPLVRPAPVFDRRGRGLPRLPSPPARRPRGRRRSSPSTCVRGRRRTRSSPRRPPAKPIARRGRRSASAARSTSAPGHRSNGCRRRPSSTTARGPTCDTRVRARSRARRFIGAETLCFGLPGARRAVRAWRLPADASRCRRDGRPLFVERGRFEGGRGGARTRRGASAGASVLGAAGRCPRAAALASSTSSARCAAAIPAGDAAAVTVLGRDRTPRSSAARSARSAERRANLSARGVAAAAPRFAWTAGDPAAHLGHLIGERARWS